MQVYTKSNASLIKHRFLLDLVYSYFTINLHLLGTKKQDSFGQPSNAVINLPSNTHGHHLALITIKRYFLRYFEANNFVT